MSLYTYVRDIYKRNRQKFFWGVTLALGSYVLTYFLKKKITEFQNRLREENQTRELVKKRFNQTQKDCLVTFQSFLPILLDPINKNINVEEILIELQKSRSIKSSSSISSDNAEKTRSKKELWEDLKLESITKLFTVIYSETLLILLIHLQLNIISRKSYMRSALKVASKSQGIQLVDAEGSQDDEQGDIAEQAFLSLTWWILNKGWPVIHHIVAQNVKDTFTDVNLREELTMDQFAELLSTVQNGTNAQLFQDGTLASILLPETSTQLEQVLIASNSVDFLQGFQSQAVNLESFEKLQSELRGYIAQSSSLVDTISSVGVSSMLYKIHTAIEAKLASTEAPAKVALLITTLASQMAAFESDKGLHMELNSIDELDHLCAAVYSNFAY